MKEKARAVCDMTVLLYHVAEMERKQVISASLAGNIAEEIRRKYQKRSAEADAVIQTDERSRFVCRL